MEAFKPKLVSFTLDIIGVNSLRLGGIQFNCFILIYKSQFGLITLSYFFFREIMGWLQVRRFLSFLPAAFVVYILLYFLVYQPDAPGPHIIGK